MKIGGRLKNVLLVTSNLPYFWLQKWVGCGPPDASLHGLCFQNSPQLIPRMEGVLGWGDKRKREGSGEGNGGWMVVWWEDQTHCHAKKHPLHPPHPEPCILTDFFPLCSAREGQTSTDWIWFICARIIWTLLRIFFWWPANVTPTLRMSLWWEAEADVRLTLPQTMDKIHLPKEY